MNNLILSLEGITAFEWLSLLIAALGFFAIAFQIRSASKHHQGNLFLEFSREFESIEANFPNEITDPRRTKALNESSRSEYSMFMKQYVNLIHREMELYENGMISKPVWMMWKNYFKPHAKNTEFLSYWKQNKTEFDPNPRFQKFIERMINDR